MSKEITYNEEARRKLKIGFDALAKAVSVTLGPKGRNVVLQKPGRFPIITKDGVSVAKEIELEDNVENMGAQMLKQVSLNTNIQAGDGTTTATVLAKAILDYGFEAIKNGEQPIDVKRSIDSSLKEIIDLLEKYSYDIEDDYEKIYEVAKVSINGDEVLAKLISDLFKQTNDSVILLEQSETKETYTDFIKGMSFTSSYVDSFFINNKKRECIYKDARVLIYDGKIKSAKDILNILEKMSYIQKPLVIISEQVSQDTILTLMANMNKGKLDSVVLNSPGFGPGRKEQLQDIATYTGGTVVRDGMIKDTTIEHLGIVKKITVKEDTTIIVGGKSDEKEVRDRIADLETMKKNQSTNNILKIDEKISKFKGGLGVIYIGANSELEYQEKYDRIEDTVNAINAALEEGIISGGGTTLYKISEEVEDSLLAKAIRSPYITIKENSGDDKRNIIQDYVDYLSTGIIDPKKVTRVALENAVSVSGTILTTECVISDK